MGLAHGMKKAGFRSVSCLHKRVSRWISSQSTASTQLWLTITWISDWENIWSRIGFNRTWDQNLQADNILVADFLKILSLWEGIPVMHMRRLWIVLPFTQRFTWVCLGWDIWHVLTKLLQGSSDLSVLTETGVMQAERCRAALSNRHFDQCFSSPISRAKVRGQVHWVFVLLKCQLYFKSSLWCSQVLKLCGEGGTSHWCFLIHSRRLTCFTLKAWKMVRSRPLLTKLAETRYV